MKYYTPPQQLRFLSDKELADQMIYHVRIRGGSKLKNGAWDMMVEAGMRLKNRWTQKGISTQMKILNDELNEEDSSNIVQFPITKAAGYEPPEGDWLGKLPMRTVFLIRKRHYAGPELMMMLKLDQSPKGNTFLASSASQASSGNWVNSARFSNQYDLVEELGVFDNDEQRTRANSKVLLEPDAGSKKGSKGSKKEQSKE